MTIPDTVETRVALARLEGKHGPALLALLRAVHRVAVEMDDPYDNYLRIQALAREQGCPGFLSLLTELELAGIVQRHRGDIDIPKEVRPLVGEFLRETEAVREAPGGEGPPELPPDLFEDIVGHGEVKELVRAAVLASRPVHVLLVGPPALAKSLFLWQLEEALKGRVWWALGSASSRAGILEVVLERRPYLLLIDELDKMDGQDQAALLSLMEGGRASRTKVGRLADERLDLRVVAAANDLRRLSPELLSRFALRRIHPYSQEEFLGVVRGVLVRHEGVEPEAAEEIARLLDGRSQDVRDAIRVARLAPGLGVGRAVELLLGGG